MQLPRAHPRREMAADEPRALRCPLCAQTFLCNSEEECNAHIAQCGAFRAEYGEDSRRGGLVSGFEEATAYRTRRDGPPSMPEAPSLESTCDALATLIAPLVPIVEADAKHSDESVELLAHLASTLVSCEPSEECTVLRETRRRAVADERGMRTKERTSGQFL